MRYKFRALTANPNGLPEHKSHWVYGLLEHSGDFNFPYTIDGCFIIPETVGLFTDFYDVNGKEIFEGDIVKNYIGEGDYGIYGVIWDESEGMWCAETDPLSDYLDAWDDIIIIGNIHETPELIVS